MKKKLVILMLGLIISVSCKKSNAIEEVAVTSPVANPVVTEVNPIDITLNGFDLLTNMQGQWIGRNKVLGWDFTWFSLDYRAISPSHTFGIYEGGSLGNLLTSFFITDYKNTRTIMARNGGLLNGIYRSSYFVLDSIRNDLDGSYYRLVDAKGGAGVMFMELRFNNDSLFFNAYTSRMGENTLPTRHMTYKAKKNNSALAQTAASVYGFPQNVVEKDFSGGFNATYLYIPTGSTEAQSSSFLAQSSSNLSVYDLASSSGDPFKINDHLNVDTLKVNLIKTAVINNAKILLYLSSQSLTDGTGVFQLANFNSILQFPEIASAENYFRFTYLHRGTYFVTAVADLDGDGLPSSGDYSSVSQQINVNFGGQHQITINNITTLN